MAGRPPTRREAVIAYFLSNPASTDTEVADAIKIDKSTVGRARRKMISDGLLPANTIRHRKEFTPREPSPRPKTPTKASVAPAAPAKRVMDSLLTDADLRALDATDVPDEDTRRAILKALRKIAFTPGMNYDVAMTAMTNWIKLKDAATAKDLGPGTPLTYAAARERMLALMKACGFELVLDCFQTLFTPKEGSDEGLVSADNGQAAQSPAGTPPAP